MSAQDATSREGLSRGAEALKERLDWDVYPESIFPPVSDEEMIRVHELLKHEMGWPLDRLSASILKQAAKHHSPEAIARIFVEGLGITEEDAVVLAELGYDGYSTLLELAGESP